MKSQPFGWGAIARLGLVQACIGAVVVLTTSTINRVMVVELLLPALLPGALVAMHYLVQFVRPRMGWGSDAGGRCTPWIAGGMTVLATGGVLAAAATVLISYSKAMGIALAVLAFLMIGVGVAACGTNLLALLAKQVDATRRAPAATLVWLMMIAGFAITAGLAGKWLDPYSASRLIAVTAVVAAIAVVVTVIALFRLEPVRSSDTPAQPPPKQLQVAPATFRAALSDAWADPAARRFTIFVFVSMLAYSSQDLILEPFAGSVFGFTPGQSTQLAGVQHGGVLLGMLLVAAAGAGWLGQPLRSLRGWAIGGCIVSAVTLAGLAIGGLAGGVWPLKANVFALGVANGAFAIAAIASMMRLAGEGTQGREGTRMGLWGAAQAVAFGLGGLIGTAASDVASALAASPGAAYAAVFALEAALFVVSAVLAMKIAPPTVLPARSMADAQPRYATS
jgi:BCD family chlorophyll transporter-like MFS transporter